MATASANTRRPWVVNSDIGHGSGWSGQRQLAEWAAMGASRVGSGGVRGSGVGSGVGSGRQCSRRRAGSNARGVGSGVPAVVTVQIGLLRSAWQRQHCNDN